MTIRREKRTPFSTHVLSDRPFPVCKITVYAHPIVLERTNDESVRSLKNVNICVEP